MHATAESSKCVSGSADGSGSSDSFVAETNARAVRLVAQLAHVDSCVDARGVRIDACGVRSAFSCRVSVRACRFIAHHVVTGTGH